jgi:uncharacterized Zn-binding protein involved in type VI secretion
MFALTLKGGMATSTAPDVCKIPAPPAGPIPTPLVNIFQLNMANPSTASKKVIMDGSPALNAQTKILLSNGDEPGVAGGVISSRFIGPGSFSPATASIKVMIEGKPAIAMGAMTFHNGDASFNTMGQCPMCANTKVMVG